jgi:hypothetical protein
MALPSMVTVGDPGPMKKQEFIRNYRAMDRRCGWWAGIVLVLTFGFALTNLFLTLGRDRNEPATTLQIVFTILFFACLIGNLPILIWVARRDRKRFRLECPKCGKPLTGVGGRIAIASGACGHCGERVFDS